MGVCATNVNAQMRVGYINPQEVLQQLPEREAIERQLASLIQQKETEFEQRENSYVSQLQQLQERVQAGSATQAQLEQQSEEFREELLDLFRSQQMEVQRRQQELLRPVLVSIDQAIEAVAVELNLSYVLNEMTSDGEMILLFISTEGENTLNITNRVVQKLK